MDLLIPRAYILHGEEDMYLVPNKLQTEAKNSNTSCGNFATRVAKVIKNSTILMLI